MNGVYPLFSSSKGNSIYIGNEERGILIDVGASLRRLTGAMERCGLSLSAVKAVFITHEHSDHVRGLSVFTKKYSVDVFGLPKTIGVLADLNMINEPSKANIISDSVRIDDMVITAFETPHDTEQSCGYRVDFDDGSSCAVCTDLGHVTSSVGEALKGVNTVLLESNYDDTLIETGPYPYHVKQRICSDHGHLSNRASAEQVRKLVETGTKNIILGHLSQENNAPVIAEHAALRKLSGFERDKDYILKIALPETTGDMVVIQRCTV